MRLFFKQRDGPPPIYCADDKILVKNPILGHNLCTHLKWQNRPSRAE
jgi:hypothetical protein